MLSDDVEFEVAPDRRTGKPIAVKLLKIKPEMLTEERISGQVGPDLHAYPFTELHACINPVKKYHFVFKSLLVCHFFYVFDDYFSRAYLSFLDSKIQNVGSDSLWMNSIILPDLNVDSKG